MTARDFNQVDVFTAEPYRGNPVAVVLDGDGLSDQEMASFARWTNLSETTFVVSPTSPEADYRLRIFTPGSELPFAGHPTLGSAHAWLEAGNAPHGGDTVVQECGVGLVRLRRDGDRLAFAAPELLRTGPVEIETQWPRSRPRCASNEARHGRTSGSTTGRAGWAYCSNRPTTCCRSNRPSRHSAG